VRRRSERRSRLTPNDCLPVPLWGAREMGGIALGMGWHMNPNDLPTLLTVDETASLLRTSRKAVYAMAERAQLPGVTRIGRRVLVRSRELLHWLDQKSALSLEE